MNVISPPHPTPPDPTPTKKRTKRTFGFQPVGTNMQQDIGMYNAMSIYNTRTAYLQGTFRPLYGHIRKIKYTHVIICVMYLSIYIYNPFLDHWWGRRRGSPQRSPCSAKAGPSGKKLRRRSGEFTEKNCGATSPNFNMGSIEDHLLELGVQ